MIMTILNLITLHYNIYLIFPLNVTMFYCWSHLLSYINYKLLFIWVYCAFKILDAVIICLSYLCPNFYFLPEYNRMGSNFHIILFKAWIVCNILMISYFYLLYSFYFMLWDQFLFYIWNMALATAISQIVIFFWNYLYPEYDVREDLTDFFLTSGFISKEIALRKNDELPLKFIKESTIYSFLKKAFFLLLSLLLSHLLL